MDGLQNIKKEKIGFLHQQILCPLLRDFKCAVRLVGLGAGGVVGWDEETKH